jgi:hypothetical protein
MSEISENITIDPTYHAKLVKMEAAARLLTQSGYMSRYREHFTQCRMGRVAWARTEGELVEAFGLRRFQDYQNFKNARTWERKRALRRSLRFIESKETPV